jgi:hypothetical protein
MIIRDSSGSERIADSPGVGIYRGHTGVSITPLRRPQRKRGRAAVAPYPFALIDVSVPGELRVGLYTTALTGVVNGVRPTLGGVGINLASAYLVVTATRVLALKAVRDYSTPSFVCTVENYANLASVPTDSMNATSFTSYLPLGTATVTSGALSLSDFDTWVDFSVENYGNINMWLPAPRGI